MNTNTQPIIGNWYQNMDSTTIFEVVAEDDKNDLIEIQYFSGEIDEIDLESWHESNIKNIPSPEDLTGPFELSKEDLTILGYSDYYIHPQDWTGPLTEIEPEDIY